MIPHVPHAKKVKGSVRDFEKGREGAGHTEAEAGAAASVARHFHVHI